MTFTQNLRGRLQTHREERFAKTVFVPVTGEKSLLSFEFLSPVALPGVSDIRVADLSFVGLLIQEVEHVFNSQWESRASVGGAEHCLKQVVHKLLQRPLVVGGPKHVKH